MTEGGLQMLDLGLFRLLFLLLVQPASAGGQVVHTQQRTVAATTAPTEVVTLPTGQGVRAVTPATASAVVSTTLSPVQSQTRPLVTQVTQGNELRTGVCLIRHHCGVIWSHQIWSMCCTPPSRRNATAARKASHRGPSANASTAAASTAGCLPTDQSCRQTPGNPPVSSHNIYTKRNSMGLLKNVIYCLAVL